MTSGVKGGVKGLVVLSSLLFLGLSWVGEVLVELSLVLCLRIMAFSSCCE